MEAETSDGVVVVSGVSMADVARVFDELDLDSIESVEALEAAVGYLAQMLRLLWVEGRLEVDDLEGLLMMAMERVGN